MQKEEIQNHDSTQQKLDHEVMKLVIIKENINFQMGLLYGIYPEISGNISIRLIIFQD